jgi:hypothetical protein
MHTSARTRSRALFATAVLLGTALAATCAPAYAATTAPGTPTHLFNGDVACSTHAASPAFVNSVENLSLEAIPQEADTADYPQIQDQFLLWPVGTPTQTTSYTSGEAVNDGDEVGTGIPASALTDGTTYAWQVRTVAGSTVSKWSKTCYLTVDNDHPAAPTISSSNYPSGSWDNGGTPVQATFGASGNVNVIGYEFQWDQNTPLAPFHTTLGAHGIPVPVYPTDKSRFVPAASSGGSASVSLIPPDPGFDTLYVFSYDRAYNLSAVASYQLYINSTAPTITALATPQFDVPTAFTLTPNPTAEAASPIVSYSVSTAGGTKTYRAGPDGTANVELTLDNPDGGDNVNVTSTSANGWVSDGALQHYYFDTTPVVDSTQYPQGDPSGGVGVPGTFTFTPQVPDIASYTYTFNQDAPTTVPADANGDAQITWTPAQGGGATYVLEVYGTLENGLQLAATDYIIVVN